MELERSNITSYSGGGNPKYAEYQQVNCEKALRLGVDECMLYNENTIDPEWRRRNAEIIKAPLGAGYWSWKAIVIFHALSRVREGDIVLYMDAGSYLVADPSPLFEIAQREDVVLFTECQHTVGQWSTRASLVLTNGEAFRDRFNIHSAYALWKKGPRAILFLAEWLTYLQDIRIVSGAHIDGVNLPEFPEFREHRHDMVPLVVSGYRWGIDFRRSPTQWGDACFQNFTNSPYKQIFFEM